MKSELRVDCISIYSRTSPLSLLTFTEKTRLRSENWVLDCEIFSLPYLRAKNKSIRAVGIEPNELKISADSVLEIGDFRRPNSAASIL